MRALLVMAGLLCAACTPTTYNPLRDRPDYVDRVLEDVTAMLEGMASAHAADRVVLQDPARVRPIPDAAPAAGSDAPRSRDPVARAPR